LASSFWLEPANPKPSRHRLLENRRRFYLVRSLGFEPESSSHDWHVQPSCQRPNRLPPERRAFSPGGFRNERERSHLQRIRLSSKPVQVTSPAACCQPIVPTGFPPVMHNLGSSTVRVGPDLGPGQVEQSSTPDLSARDRTHLPPTLQCLFSAQGVFHASAGGRRFT
jgi:hypothetical protein